MRMVRAAWAERVQRWRRSGRTAREFAESIGVKPATLAYWAWRLRREEGDAQPRPRRRRRANGAGAEPPFVEVIVDGPAAGGFVLELGDGRQLRIAAGFEAPALTRLLTVLEGPRR